jgi:hypothetical protein
MEGGELRGSPARWAIAVVASMSQDDPVQPVNADADDVARPDTVDLEGVNVSSWILGAPYSGGVAPASTYGHRGAMIDVPNVTSLGFTR